VTDVTASPLKLFEYAAAARPIMLPDLPALKEILPPDQAVYFPRGSVEGMLEALEWTYAHPDQANAQAQAAYRSIEGYTYTNRARSILALLD
jgi:glycosyltransferase involved in cell wall biosynthesis